MSTPAPSRRLADRLRQVEESRTMQVVAAAQRLRAEGRDVVDLGAGEPDFATPGHVKEAAKRAIESDFTKYTAAAGTPELRDAILRRFSDDFGVERTRREVIATVGGKQSIFNVLLALVNPGDEVLVPAPYWVTFPQVVHLCGGTPVAVAADEQKGFQITARMIEAHLTSKTSLIVLNSPNNPSGSVIQVAELLRICELAARRRIYVLVDECYQKIVYDGLRPSSAAAVPVDLRPWVIVAGSLSKTYAMTGWRIGFTIGPEDLVSHILVIQGHETSNPNSVAQMAAIEALLGPQDCVEQMRREYERRRDYFVPALNGIPGIRCHVPQGAFYAFASIREILDGVIPSSDAFAARLLQDAGLAVTPGSGFGIEGYIRLSFAASMNTLEKAVHRLDVFVRETLRLRGLKSVSSR
jgi:aspartate aminotransferase